MARVTLTPCFQLPRCTPPSAAALTHSPPLSPLPTPSRRTLQRALWGYTGAPLPASWQNVRERVDRRASDLPESACTPAKEELLPAQGDRVQCWGLTCAHSLWQIDPNLTGLGDRRSRKHAASIKCVVYFVDASPCAEMCLTFSRCVERPRLHCYSSRSGSGVRYLLHQPRVRDGPARPFKRLRVYHAPR